MTKKKWFVFIFITILLIVFYCIISILKGIEYTDKITICISFTGLFATFGGAYLGAKISGDNARKNMEIQLKAQKAENKKSEVFNRKRLNVEMKNNRLNDYLTQLNEYDSILQKIEVEIKNYLLFTLEFGSNYKECTKDEYYYNRNRRINEFHQIITNHLEIEKQRNTVIICRNILYENNYDIPNITINMLEPIVNIETSKIEAQLYIHINNYLNEKNNIYGGLKEFLNTFKWIDKEKENAINVIKKNLKSLDEY